MADNTVPTPATVAATLNAKRNSERKRKAMEAFRQREAERTASIVPRTRVARSVSSISAAERAAINRAQKLRKIRGEAARAEKLLNDLLTIGGRNGILAYEMSNRSSNVNNPESRYGRTGWR